MRAIRDLGAAVVGTGLIGVVHVEALCLELAGSDASLAWNEQLRRGHRGRPNETLWRERGTLPPGHAEGFEDTFEELYRAVYAAVAAGEAGGGHPTFGDGHRQNVPADAILLSSREERWAEVPR